MKKADPISIIREKALNEEIDYNLLSACLSNYAAPRDVITRLLEQGALIRVKKGLYVFGERYRRRVISLEVLANLIYGPSYISREYALSFYSLIPEAVYEITSMTTKRNKNFKTPLGRFSYRHLIVDKFPVGVTLVKLTEHQHALMATPEKALADYLYVRKEKTAEPNELKSILLDDYRIDEENLAGLNIILLEKIAKVYNNPTIELLARVVKEFKDA